MLNWGGRFTCWKLEMVKGGKAIKKLLSTPAIWAVTTTYLFGLFSKLVI